ncbi:polyprenyl synthetase family protein [Aerococcaceae bacterium NML130460]|nr:polyprenyl synthetase family protein [Aerococcaceae bacterium NML191219]MCW6674546.1 polyprenyl synthetase family protein [Aerococcaceae bacterium NML171108]MCW6679642.1 polyprenyl synthetase family protein [Aerococcaceae bacterium NML130460]MDO4775666.1 polyprenyl synthetase family protein [Aerococcaceae bacterium]
MNITDIHTLRDIFERALKDRVRYTMTPIELLTPMVYSLQNGGKRLRPTMLLTVLAIQSPDQIKLGLNTGMALEFIHTYSLIHDDLPAMDNDDLRRGQPTNHIQFGEATAILAGDALLTDAFDLIVGDDYLSDRQKVRLTAHLSKAAGSLGMVAGQLADMQSDNQNISLAQLRQIHSLKTGKLFTFAVEAGAIIANLSEDIALELVTFSEHFGRAYQIHNDLMDVVGTTDQTGKQTQADAVLEKSTYPQLMGLEGAKQELASELQQAVACLERLSKQTGKDYLALAPFLDYLQLG